jgi:hypothetical protein
VLGIGGVSAAAALSSGGGNDAQPVPMPKVLPDLVVQPPTTPTATPLPSASTAPAPLPTKRAAPVDPRALRLTVVGKVSWVKVVGPRGKVLFVGMLRHGRTLSFLQRPLTITLGDAGAVRVSRGRTVYAHAGRPGEVRVFHVTS